MDEDRSYLDAAKLRLSEGRQALSLGMARIAAREGYMAAFHAAQALILHASGKVAKTHSGVRTEFARLAQRFPAINPLSARFLAYGYEQKTVADYGLEPGTQTITREHAADTMDRAERLIAEVEAALNATPSAD